MLNVVAFHRSRLRDFCDRLLRSRWGGKSFIMLCVSLFSGIVVALQYDLTAPFYSSTSLDLIIPFGAFWRSLHFYSSQLFFAFGLLHFISISLERKINLMPFSKWLNLCLSIPVGLLLLFTGYILRGDATGEAAGFIAENISLSVPWAGNLINQLLFAVSTSGLKKIFANHIAGLVFLWIVLSWDHIRRYRIEWSANSLELIGLMMFCALVNAPLEVHGPGASLIGGPWFFLGLQELLRAIRPFVAGVLFPFSLIVALVLLYEDRCRKYSLLYIILWCSGYTILTIKALLRL